MGVPPPAAPQGRSQPSAQTRDWGPAGEFNGLRAALSRFLVLLRLHLVDLRGARRFRDATLVFLEKSPDPLREALILIFGHVTEEVGVRVGGEARHRAGRRLCSSARAAVVPFRCCQSCQNGKPSCLRSKRRLSSVKRRRGRREVRCMRRLCLFSVHAARRCWPGFRGGGLTFREYFRDCAGLRVRQKPAVSATRIPTLRYQSLPTTEDQGPAA